MGNSLTRNPIFIDTFSADYVISSAPIKVKKIRLFSAADGDILVLEDRNGNKTFYLTTLSNADPVEVDFGEGQWFDGLQMDVSDCTGLGTNDFVWIYLAGK